jgi:hypothetical protein
MGTTLYLLRQHPDRIPSSLFQTSDAGMDIVFIEEAALIPPSSVKGVAVSAERTVVGCSHPIMTYDDLIEKIFLSEHIIVL